MSGIAAKILEKQDGKGEAAMARREFVPFLQRLQNKGS